MPALKRSTVTPEVGEALNTLSYRIEKAESDFLGHLHKVESKLDQIAEITRTVAVLQQQTNQQTDQIVEVRTQLREYMQKNDASISRIHTRIDESVNNIRDKIDFSSKETSIHLTQIDDKAEDIEKELKQWLNRGKGAWYVVVFTFAILQGGAGYLFSSLINRLESVEAKLSTQANILKETESNIFDLWKKVTEK